MRAQKEERRAAEKDVQGDGRTAPEAFRGSLGPPSHRQGLRGRRSSKQKLPLCSSTGGLPQEQLQQVPSGQRCAQKSGLHLDFPTAASSATQAEGHLEGRPSRSPRPAILSRVLGAGLRASLQAGRAPAYGSSPGTLLPGLPLIKPWMGTEPWGQGCHPGVARGRTLLTQWVQKAGPEPQHAWRAEHFAKEP